jgi:hypothetical protein
MMTGASNRHLLRAIGRCLLPVVLLPCCDARAASDGDFGAEAWSVEGPRLSIGSVDDPAYAFQSVAALAMSPAGVLHSLHRNEATIRRWDAAGKPLDALGRSGEGPGEFDTPSALGFFGDSLWVFDRGAYRVSYFDSAGTFLDVIVPRVDISANPDNPGGSMARPSLPLRDGSFYGVEPAWSDAIARGQLSQVAHVHMDREGTMTGTVWVQPYRPMDILALLRESGGTFSAQPFADGPISHVSSDGVLTVLDRRSSTSAEEGTMRLTKIAMTGDKLLTKDIAYVPDPLPKERVDSASAATAARMHEFMRRRDPGLSLAKLEADIDAATYSPDFLPPVRSMVVAEDGSIWLERFTPSAGGVTWWVLDHDAEPVATAVTPVGLQVRLITSDAVWGIEIDELDVNHIVKYDLVRR